MPEAIVDIAVAQADGRKLDFRQPKTRKNKGLEVRKKLLRLLQL